MTDTKKVLLVHAARLETTVIRTPPKRVIEDCFYTVGTEAEIRTILVSRKGEPLKDIHHKINVDFTPDLIVTDRNYSLPPELRAVPEDLEAVGAMHSAPVIYMLGYMLGKSFYDPLLLETSVKEYLGVEE